MKVCYPFVGDSIGGAQLSALTLIRHLPAEIEPVIVVHTDGPLMEHLRKNKIDYLELPSANIAGQKKNVRAQLTALALITPKTAGFLRSHQIDLVHTQDGRMNISWWPGAHLLGVPQIWHQRSRFAASRLQNFMIERSPNIVAISNTARQSLPTRPRNRANVVYNPVEVLPPRSNKAQIRASLLSSLEQEYGQPADNPIVIASVGNLRAVKQPMLQIATAIAVSRNSDRPACLALFGEDREGWINKMRSAIAESGTNTTLIAMGFKHPIEDWLVGCDVLLAVSDGDAFGRTLVEAMGVGVPVVATAAAGHTEIVSDHVNGVLAETGSAEELANGVSKVIEDKIFHDGLVQGGRRRAKDFSPDKHVGRMVELYGALTTND